MREGPPDRQAAPSAGGRAALHGLDLHRGRRTRRWRVDDQVDPRIGRQTRAVDAELEQLVLHEQLASSADVLRRSAFLLGLERHRAAITEPRRRRHARPG